PIDLVTGAWREDGNRHGVADVEDASVRKLRRELHHRQCRARFRGIDRRDRRSLAVGMLQHRDASHHIEGSGSHAHQVSDLPEPIALETRDVVAKTSRDLGRYRIARRIEGPEPGYGIVTEELSRDQ